jgi:NAD(P) transhydrogenase
VHERDAMLLPFVDRELVSALEESLGPRVELRLGASVTRVRRQANGTVHSFLEDGSWVVTVAVLHAAGRRGATEGLGLEEAGVEVDAHGLVPVDDACRTSVESILAAGDVTGARRLAGSSMLAGRRAARAALGAAPLPPDGPPLVAIWTIPELAMAGPAEQELAASAPGLVSARAGFAGLARGRIEGRVDGFVKLVADAATHRVLAAYAFGPEAAELVHVGHAAVLHGDTLEQLAARDYAHPTYVEAYRAAALGALRASSPALAAGSPASQERTP